MKKLKQFREFIKRLYSVFTVASSDEYVTFTYNHTEGGKYDFEYRSSFPMGNDLVTDMNHAIFTWLAEHHHRKQLKANEETIEKLLKP